jgi:hypothetical protein
METNTCQIIKRGWPVDLVVDNSLNVICEVSREITFKIRPPANTSRVSEYLALVERQTNSTRVKFTGKTESKPVSDTPLSQFSFSSSARPLFLAACSAPQYGIFAIPLDIALKLYYKSYVANEQLDHISTSEFEKSTPTCAAVQP